MELVSILKSEDLDEIEVRTLWRTVRVARRSQKVSASPETIVSAPSPAVPAIEDMTTPVPKPEPVSGKDTEEKEQPGARELTPAGTDEGMEEIVSPMVGTFYSSPGPDIDSFVTPGQHVEVGQVICIIEAMKLMNEVEAEKSGTIKKILVNNSQPVEFGQPLFLIESA